VKITLLVPTLNEIDGMKEIMPRVRREWVDEICVIDGGSTDGTLDYAESQGYRILRQKRKWLAGGYLDAMEHIENDVVLSFSPDGNSIPELIPELIEKFKEGYDMVIVSRYLGPAKSQDDDWLTGFGNWLFTSTINLLFGSSYTDSLVMYRAWRTDILRSVAKDVILSAGIEPLLTIRCAKRKLKVGEIPGNEPKRIGGTRKLVPLVNGFAILCLILRERLSWS